MRTLFLSLFAITALLLATPVIAQTVDLKDMPKDKIEQIQSIVNDAKTTTQQVTEAVNPKVINEYVEIGKSLGAAMAAAAKETGMALLTFSDTWVGRMVIIGIAWKLLLGEVFASFISVGLGVLWAGIAIRIWTKYFRELCLIKDTTIEESEEPVRGPDGLYVKNESGKGYVTVPVKRTVTSLRDSDDDIDGRRFVMFALLAISMIPAMILVF